MPADQLVSISKIEVAPNGGITPCIILNRGIDNAARRGNADFRIELSLTFDSNGQKVTEVFSIPISETREVRNVDAKSVEIDTTVQTAKPVDQGSTIDGTVELVRRADDTDPGDPIADPGSAQAVVRIEDIDVAPNGGITPCIILVRGIDTASRDGNAAFRLGLSLTFLSNGQSKTESFTIPISETRLVGDHDASSVEIDATLQTQSPVDQGSAITGTVQLLHKNTSTNIDDPIGDPIPFP